MLSPAPATVSLAAPEAWLAVPPRRSAGWKMVATGVAFLAMVIYNTFRWHWGTVMLVIAVVLGLLALLLVYAGLTLALRRRPILSADASGISASFTGFDSVLVPWRHVVGIELVGKKDQRSLVVLVDDPEAFFASQKRLPMRDACRKFNKQHNVSGAAYVLARTMDADAEIVAQRLRELAVRALEDADAGSPAGA